jgi:hypothetical protein
MSGDCAERLAGKPINHQLQVNVTVLKLHQVDVVEFYLEFVGDEGGVLRAQPKGYECPGVAQDRIADIRLELV